MVPVRPRVFTLAAAAILILYGLRSPGIQAERSDQSAGSQPATSSTIDPLALKSYQWRSVGPARAGRSIAVSGVKGRPKEAYTGQTGGGLWKTADGGESWLPVTDGKIHSSSVGAVAVSESNPDIVFIGMGESCIRGNIQPGDGVYKSTDAGRTWTHVGFAESQAISKIRIHPTNPDIVYVASFGKYGVPSDERGIFKSTDGGKTWRKTLFRDSRTGGVDIAIDPHNPNVMFAALWEAFRVEYSMSSGGPGSGLFKSTDAGETWTEITRRPGLPTTVLGKIGVAVSGADPDRIYAIVEAEHGGLFSSDDAGATWKLANEGRNIRQRAFYYTHVAADPHNRDIVYALNVGTFRSIDGGKTMASFASGDSHDFWIDPDDSNHIVHANDSGGAVSFNAGSPQRTWTARDYPTGQFYHVVATKHLPYHVCGAQQDSSTVCLPSEAAGGRGGGGGGGRGAAQPTYSPGGAEPGYIAPDPKDTDVYFAGGNNGSFLVRLNRKTGESREVSPYPRMFSGEPSSSLVERWQWTYPIIFSPLDPHVLYTSSQHLWKTTNGGQTWDRISPDLTRHDPKTMGESGGPITKDMNAPEVYGTIFAIGPGKKDVNTIWTGSDDGVVEVTRDGGKTWSNVTPKEMPDLGRVSQIDASAFEAGAAYVAVKKPLLNDLAPYIFRTRDFGRTWTTIVNGIPATDYVHVVREDPTRPGLLYAGTQHSVYVSFNDGDRWEPLGLNLPDTQVSDLIVEANSLAIATHGRGFYILDDIAPLRQAGISTSSAGDPVLFRPADAIRGAGNATVSYLLKSPVPALTVDILDSKGSVVRSFPGTAAAAERGGRGGRGGRAGAAVSASPGSAPDTTTPSGGAPAAPVQPPAAGAAGEGAVVPASGAEEDNPDAPAGGRGRGAAPGAPMAAGLNRVAWDLRYAPATSFPGMILWGGAVTGPAAPPGTYQVRLTVGGTTLTQPLVVKRHPLRSATDADLKEQFELAIQIRDKVSEANDSVIRIRNMKSQITERLTKATGDSFVSAAGKLTGSLSALEEQIYQVKNQSGQDPLNFPIRINNRLASLLSAVNSGDGKPIGNAAAIFKDLSGELKIQTDRLQRVIDVEIPVVNAEGAKAGVAAITAK